MSKFLVRSVIILFWIGLFSCTLYWPKWNVISYDDKTINVFAWGDILEPGVIATFEKETGH